MPANDVQIARAAVEKIAQILSRRRIRVTQRGDMAFCEADDDGQPKRINLPFLPDDASETVLRATQGYLDHEVGHALFTDFASVRDAAADGALLKMLHNIVEDTLIERQMASRFRGSAYNLEETRRFVLDQHVAPALADKTKRSADQDELFTLLLMPMVRAWAGQEVMNEFMDDKWGLVAKRSALFADMVDRFARVEDSWDALVVAREMEKRLRKGAPELHALMSAQAEAAEAAMAAAIAGEATATAEASERDEMDGPMLFERALARAISRAIGAERSDDDWRAFTTDFDKIEPMPLGGKDWSEPLGRMRHEIESMVGPMARAIERMVAAQKQTHWLGGRRRGRLNTSSLHRAALGDDRLFRHRVDRRAKNTAVSLVVDLSGSMAGRRVWVACAAALALSETLTRADVAHEAIGFTTLDPDQSLDKAALAELRRLSAAARRGRSRTRRSGGPERPRHAFSRHEPLYLPLLKGFDERLTPATRPRFAAAACSRDTLRNNVDHESIRQAGLRLAARSEPRRVMIVFSDGEPAFDGDVIAAQRLLKEEVESLERGGVEVFGVGVESDAVESYYPRHAVIGNVDELPDALLKLLRRVLG